MVRSGDQRFAVMSIVSAAQPNLLRRLIKAIKRSPMLTQFSWWLVKRFPALGRTLASRMIRPIPDRDTELPVLIVPMLAWDAANPSTPTSQPLQRRLSHALDRSESGSQ